MARPPIYPMLGYNIGSIRKEEIFVEIGYAVPGQPAPKEERLRVRISRERARELGEHLLDAADTPHKEPRRH